eukprot:CAMPEP_0201521970 /NCGR_PEP_ID=MMETSP0161_2-20130828/16383_1 /ASSEMBLY_ACC=CAM_ASM_000251 /TAXON_ID=180227 /ORGANISM="Neoparamoeba aestuarina, Strain SoJaBio B1-5/56/2" /LENGTH=73 /DNA_ID=CAMNT_0047920713 /DNA_START=165 /DNA_END=383 /DNA_ORIENTATION=-
MVKKEKACAVCAITLAESDIKRFRVVSGPNAKAWGKLVDKKLYPGDRICGSHLPNQWKKKASKLDLSEEEGEE